MSPVSEDTGLNSVMDLLTLLKIRESKVMMRACPSEKLTGRQNRKKIGNYMLYFLSLKAGYAA